MDVFWRGFLLCIGVIVGTFIASSLFSTERYESRNEVYNERLITKKEDEEEDKT